MPPPALTRSTLPSTTAKGTTAHQRAGVGSAGGVIPTSGAASAASVGTSAQRPPSAGQISAERRSDMGGSLADLRARLQRQREEALANAKKKTALAAAPRGSVGDGHKSSIAGNREHGGTSTSGDDAAVDVALSSEAAAIIDRIQAFDLLEVEQQLARNVVPTPPRPSARGSASVASPAARRLAATRAIAEADDANAAIVDLPDGPRTTGSVSCGTAAATSIENQPANTTGASKGAESGGSSTKMEGVACGSETAMTDGGDGDDGPRFLTNHVPRMPLAKETETGAYLMETEYRLRTADDAPYVAPRETTHNSDRNISARPASSGHHSASVGTTVGRDGAPPQQQPVRASFAAGLAVAAKHATGAGLYFDFLLQQAAEVARGNAP